MSWKRLIGTTFVAVLALCMVQGSVVKAEPEFIQLPGEAVELLDVNNTLYFSSSSGTHGNLSKTDGTVAGTEVITSDPASNITKVGNSVFFTTYNQTTQLNELWKTDGTPGDSMRLVEAIGFGTRFGEFNGRLLFTSIDKDNMYGHELWSSDGTVAGTHMVKDINPIGDGIRSRMALLHIGNAVYFSATDGVNDYKLWKTDGTEAGTVMVNDDPVTGDTNTGSLVEFNGKIVFNNTTSLWVSDGTAAGTYALNAPLVRTATDKKTVQAQQVGGTLFYTALDGTLWKTDGTAAGTAMVDPLRQIHVQNSNSPLTEFNGTLYFNGADGNNDYEFWKSDGTPAGTQLVANLKLIGASNPVYFKTYENNLYFSAFDQNSSHDVLWKYSGVPGSVPERFGSLAGDVLEKIVVSDVLYINQNAGTGYLKLWRLQEQEGITAPANLAAPSPAKVANLTWNTVAGADHYDVYRDGNSVGSTSVNSFNDNAPDGTYEYTVAAVGAGGVSSGPSGGVSVVIDNAVPAITGITWTANPLLQGQNATLSISANDALS
ncbi:MAG TPA: hypothetical protein VLF43_05465, partial [Candidatus Saccharimonadales bacterium]|nr:hypothetical protein [Candidatus Saccharimonadales bacterium]